jgi:hypothetical protein
MDKELQLRCRCGRVRGLAQISSETGTHLVCYCDDCQAFVHHLDRTDVLDAHGGTTVFQMAPSRLRITEGADALRCLRLSPKGMFRWYTDCCRTPVANTAGRIPFVGLISAFMDLDADGRSREAILGKPNAVMARFAVGGIPEGAHAKASPALIARVLSRLLGWWLTRKGQPSPFVDANSKPRAEPLILTPEQRAAATPVVGAAASATH